ncbi:DUF202 domain-containing protein [Corynebacterium pacaense]|uniref:DUF202 domain-containing protein n=1 Tax=Corynebacterium pacaense TaxID=1816684 RepID=UPI0009B9FA0B|nr:DUF202 domain-containing protein [Corynebacterium pacaense]
MSAPLQPLDPGLQPERTSLAWERTAISLALASAILLRWSPQFGSGVHTLILAVLGVAVVLYLTQARRYRDMGYALVRGRRNANVRAVVTLTAALIVFGISGFVLVLAAL